MFQKLTVRQVRVMMGLTQAQLAEKLGVSKNSIANYENDPQRMSIKFALSFCEFAGITIEELALDPAQ